MIILNKRSILPDVETVKEYLPDVDDDFYPYRRLLFAILIRFLNDINSKDQRKLYKYYNKKLQFLVQSEMMEFICDCLGFRYNIIKNFFEKELKENNKLQQIETIKNKKNKDLKLMISTLKQLPYGL